jgi:hypothetical protein
MSGRPAGENGEAVERYLAREADSKQGESYGAPFLCLRSTSYQLSADDFLGREVSESRSDLDRPDVERSASRGTT